MKRPNWKRTSHNLYAALRLLADKGGIFHNWENGQGEDIDERLNAPMREFRQLKRLKK